MAGAQGHKVVLFGAGAMARLLWSCLSQDSPHEVAGFTVDQSERSRDRLEGLPLVPFEQLEDHFPPDRYHLLLAIGPHQVNAPRAARYEDAKARGYRFASYLSSRARLWPDLEIGEGSMIFQNAVVEPFSRIGVNTVLRASTHVSHDGRLADHVFLAPRATLAGNCRVGARSFLGVNATLRDGITVAERCIVGAGAVVARTTEPGGLYVGVPARRVRESEDVSLWGRRPGPPAPPP